MSELVPSKPALGTQNAAAPGVSTAERTRLHALLDALLDKRDQWERRYEAAHVGNAFLHALSYAHLSETEAGFDAREILGSAAKLMRDGLGSPMRSAALQRPIGDGDGDGGKRVLIEWLTLLQPVLEAPVPTLLGGNGNNYLEIIDVLVGLSALEVGEVQPLFKPGHRGNKPANSYSLATSKLRALQLKESLGALGYGDGEANNLISLAFGEQWDTIRKWRQSCSSVLGEVLVGYCIASAKDVSRYRPSALSKLFGASRSISEDVRLAGHVYRRERKRSARASRSKRVSEK